MKRFFITSGLIFALSAFICAQDNTTQSTTTTTTQTTTQSSPSNPAAGRPQGTKVTKHESDTLVQPSNAPVKVTPSVVKAAQQKLDDGGYNAGPADGILGPQTSAALKKFQAEQNLAPTGRLDQKTLAALNVGGVQELTAAPKDLGRAGKAIGHDTVGGHPVEAGKAAVTGSKNFGKKVGQGTESTAVKVKDKVGSGLSAVGEKITGAGEKTKKAGETTEQKSNDAKTNSKNPPKR